MTTVIEVRHVLRSGLQLEEISDKNKFSLACNRLDATRKRIGRDEEEGGKNNDTGA